MDLAEKEPTKGVKAGEFWTQKLDDAIKWRGKHWNGDKEWHRYKRLYAGLHWKARSADTLSPDSDNVRKNVTVNRTGSIILSMLPFLVRRNPNFILHARHAEKLQSAKLKEGLLNYLWREHKMQRQLKKATLDATVIGHGIVKTGHVLEIMEDKLSGVKSDETIQYRDYIKSNHPFIQRISPFRFFFDPDAIDGDLDSARWCAEIIFKPVRDVLENERYDKKARALIRRTLENKSAGIKQMHRDGSVPSVSTVKSFLRQDDNEDKWMRDDTEDGDSDRIVLFELWDKRTYKYYVFAHGIHTPLVEEESWPYEYLEGFPYKMLPFIPVVDEPFPIGIPRWIEDQQLELNRTRSFEFEHRRRFVRKYAANKNQIEEGEFQKFKSGADGEVVLVDGDPNDIIVPIQDAPLPADQYRIEDLINQDFRELTGADELLQGGALPSRTTATEIGARQQIIGLKVEARVNDIDEFTEDVGRQVLQHVEANYVTDTVVRILGPQGFHWVSLSKEDIQAEVDFELESTSSPRTDPELERQQRVQIFQLIMQSLPIIAQLAPVMPNLGIGMTQFLQWTLEGFDRSKQIAAWFEPMMEILAPPQESGGGVATPGGGIAPPPGLPGGTPQPEVAGAQAGQGGQRSAGLGAAFGGGGGGLGNL